VLLGGDYVNMQWLGGGRVPPRVIARILARITGRHGRFAILGNHDYNYGDQEVPRRFAPRHHRPRPPARQLHRSADMPSTWSGCPMPISCGRSCEALLASLAPDRPTIVLTHDPVWFKDVPPGRI
jgi:predicted MPP superfamily phosphohydrolase